jgi:hypothetical protein
LLLLRKEGSMKKRKLRQNGRQNLCPNPHDLWRARAVNEVASDPLQQSLKTAKKVEVLQSYMCSSTRFSALSLCQL